MVAPASHSSRRNLEWAAVQYVERSARAAPDSGDLEATAVHPIADSLVQHGPGLGHFWSCGEHGSEVREEAQAALCCS